MREWDTPKANAKAVRCNFSVCVQWNIRTTGVSVREGPFRFAVANEPQTGRSFSRRHDQFAFIALVYLRCRCDPIASALRLVGSPAELHKFDARDWRQRAGED